MASEDEKVLPLQLVIDLLSEVIIKENLIDPVYEISSGSVKGDGYASSMTIVNVKGNDKVLPLVIKSTPKNASVRETIPIRVMFLQEIKYYQEIFPAFKKFQSERGVKNPFNSIPLCYKTLDNENGELLVLENIKENGFKPVDKKKQMDEAHVEMVLRLYGQLHAISFSMKEHDMRGFKELTENLDRPFSMLHFKQELYDMYIDGAEKIKSVFDENTEPDVYKCISSLRGKVMPFFKTLDNYDGKYGVITHGDCWSNNMMFKYENGTSSPPTDIRLYDFQIGTLTTPVFDLSYFFYVSASQDMMDNLDYYLKVYHDSLRKNMLEMGSDVDEWFPFSTLKDEWKQFGKCGIYFASSAYRAMLREDDEILDFTDETDAMKDAFMKSSKNDHLINEKYRRIGLHFYNNNFI